MEKLDELNYGLALKRLLKQTFSNIRYRELSKWQEILLKILMFPLYILLFLLIAQFILTYGAFKIVSSPIDYLDNLLHREGKDVQHATQFIIYFIGFPVVLFGNMFLAFISVVLFVEFLLINLIATPLSLGDCQFAPFINDQPKRGPRAPLENASKVGMIKTVYLSSLVGLGIILEIVNAALKYDRFAPAAMCFIILYILGVCMMGVGKMVYDEDEEELDNVEIKPSNNVNKLEDQNVAPEIDDDLGDDFVEFKE